MKARLLVFGVALVVRLATASAEDTDASIPFANMGGIYDWSADGPSALYIQSISKQWYHVQLLAPCFDLPFAERVGFVSEPGSGTFDKFSSILVRGQECPVKAIARSGPPPSRAKHFRGASANAAAPATAPK
jgi:hypothetical protein